MSFDNLLDIMLKNNLITEHGIRYINEINSIPDETEDVATIITEIEKQIYFSGMSIEEQSFPLLFASVAKSSSLYILPKNQAQVFKLKWPWKADAHGAVAGAIGGSIAGVTAGGVGAFIGGILGAIGGGIGESCC